MENVLAQVRAGVDTDYDDESDDNNEDDAGDDETDFDDSLDSDKPKSCTIQYLAFGDMGYRRSDVFMTPFKKRHLSPLEQKNNEIFKKLRVSIEWSFGCVVRYFPYTAYKMQMIAGRRPIPRYYKVAVILQNCHVCLYGHQTAHSFRCPPPSLAP